jgi:hypothetical protein
VEVRIFPAGWPPRNALGFVALLASIGGAMALTAFSIWIISIIAEYGRSYPEVRARVVDALAGSNYGLLVILGAILLSLGLAINRRSLKASAFGASFDASGGDDLPDAPQAAQAVADSAQATADVVKDAAQ